MAAAPGSVHRFRVRCGTLPAIALAAAAICVPSHAHADSRPPVAGSAVAAELRQTIASGHLSLLRAPNFRQIQSSVSAVYEQNAYVPLWIEGATVTSKGSAILEALSRSGSKGLHPEDYDAALLRGWAARIGDSGGAGQDVAMLDLALTVDLMRYASALHEGRVDPRTVHFAIRPKDRLDPAAFIRDYLASDQGLPALLAQVEPPFRGYRNTLAALVRYRQLASEESPRMPVRPRRPLQPGQSYADVGTLADRLALLGDLSPAPGVQNGVYGGALVDAVKRLQSRHGLAATGSLDAVTWRALTTPLSRRIEQLELTLERWRWLPSTVTPTIVVNIPEFELRAYDENRQLALRMHVIVGKAYRHRTPVFEDKLETIIIRPWWNVPLNIQRNEMIPEIRSHPEYLTKNNLQVFDNAGNPAPKPALDELLQGLSLGELRLRQEPGETNSLGLLKFDFPNDYSIYMHGTPARQLFSQARRDFSHGCIRVEDPESLAAWVLRHDPAWNREKIAGACNADVTRRIAVSPPISVLVLYGTAVVEEDGSVHFFDDLYGYDAELKKALGAGGEQRQSPSASARQQGGD